MFKFLRRWTQKKPSRPPSQSQLDLCEDLGIPVPAAITRERLGNLIEKSIAKEPMASRFEERKKRLAAEFEQEERELYGDEIYDEYLKWTALDDPFKKYEVIYKSRQNIRAEIIEMDGVDIVGDEKFRVEVTMLHPKIRKTKEFGDVVESIDWEKEVSINTTRILSITELSENIDIFDISKYQEAKKVCDKKAKLWDGSK